MRRTAQLLGIAKRTMVKKVQWLAEEARKAHAKFLATTAERTSFVQADEMETYENSKLKPLSTALAVRHKTGQIIGAKVASMNCHGRMAAISRAFYGARPDTRAQAFRDVLRNVSLVAQTELTIATDGKDAYCSIIKEVLPNGRPRRSCSAETQ